MYVFMRSNPTDVVSISRVLPTQGFRDFGIDFVDIRFSFQPNDRTACCVVANVPPMKLAAELTGYMDPCDYKPRGFSDVIARSCGTAVTATVYTIDQTAQTLIKPDTRIFIG